MEEKELDVYLEELVYDEVKAFTRRTVREKKMTKRAAKRRNKKTNFTKVKPRKGWKRVKIGSRYVSVRMGGLERQTKTKVGKRLGKEGNKFKK